MKIKKMSLRINTIRRAANTRNPGLPGNLFVNGKEWFSARDVNNLLLGNDLNPQLPAVLLVGQTINFEQLTVEATDLENADKTFVHIHENTRKVPYKQVGVHNINIGINFSDEKLMTLVDLSMKYKKTISAPTAAAAPVKEIVEEVAPIVAPEPETPVHEALHEIEETIVT